MSVRTPDYFTSVRASGGRISGQLQNKDGSIPDISSATLIFLMRQAGAEDYKVEATATVTDGEDGRWEYEWQEEDRDTPGDFKVNIVCALPDGQTDVYPEPGYVLVRVSSDD